MSETKCNRPVFIIGCPHSGTRMLARVLGRARGVALITEHTDKKIVPEDDCGIIDSLLWRSVFGLSEHPDSSISPLEDAVRHDESAEHMRSILLAAARGRRLVAKNPNNTLRVPLLRQMFPDAQFVFLVRDPWATIQSMTRTAASGQKLHASVLRSSSIAALPNDMVLRAAASWCLAADAADEHCRGADYRLRYEDILADPPTTIHDLYQLLGLELDSERSPFDVVVRRDDDCGLAKYLLSRCPYRDQVLEMVAPRARRLGYAVDPTERPGSLFRAQVQVLKRYLAYRKRKPYGMGSRVSAAGQ